MANSSNHSPEQEEENIAQQSDTQSVLDDEIVLKKPNISRKLSGPVTYASRLAEVDLNSPNLILESARPLLRILTNIPEQMTQNEVTSFRNILEDEIDIFFRIGEHLSLKREHVITARYCICTALDEAINRTSWGGGDESGLGLWPKESLLSTFHKDSYGGDKLFLLTGKLSANPGEHIDVLELIYYLLELGFEGRYRHDPNGKRQLEAIQSRLLNIINSERQTNTFSLAPNWNPAPEIKKKTGWRFPARLTLLIAAIILAGQFLWYKFNLNHQAEKLSIQITNIGDIPFKPQQIAFEKPKLQQLLQPEIEAQILTLTGTDNSDLISFRGDGMFASGKASVDAKLEPTFQRIVAELKKLPNVNIVVTGHSDNVPMKSAEFKSNDELSQARAEAVAGLLEKNGYSKSLIQAIGKGANKPVAPNNTPEGRARNRRVEILVQYGQGTEAQPRLSSTSATAEPAKPASEASAP